MISYDEYKCATHQGERCSIGPEALLNRHIISELMAELNQMLLLDNPLEFTNVYANETIKYSNRRYELYFDVCDDTINVSIIDHWTDTKQQEYNVELASPTAIESLLDWLSSTVAEQENIEPS